MKSLYDNQIVLLIADDWEGLYVNEHLKTEDHRVERRELVKYMQQYQTFNVEYRYLNDDGDNWIQEQGSFPLYLEQIDEKYVAV